MTRFSDRIVQFTGPRSARSGRGMEPIKIHEFTLNFDHADMVVASTTATIDMSTGDDGSVIPADATILDWAHDIEVAFAGGSISAITTDVGDAADIDEMNVAVDLETTGYRKTLRGVYGRELKVVPLDIVDLIAANTFAARYLHRGPTATVELISTVAGVAVDVNATITTAIGATEAGLVAVTNGVVTIASAGAAIGDIDTATPTAANSLAAGSYLRAIVGGGNTVAGRAAMTLSLREAVRRAVLEPSAYGLRASVTAVGDDLDALTGGRAKFYVAYQCLENPLAA